MQSGYRFRSPFRAYDDGAFIEACAEDLRDVIATQTAGDIAALIAEPVQGVGGFAIPPDGFFGPVEKVCREHDMLFISDEVQTGWGRTGDHFWGYQAHGITPDLMTFAKGLGNGLTIAGVVGRAEIMNSISANSISTFGGNPLSCAGALANLHYLLDHDLQANTAARGAQLMEALLRPWSTATPALGRDPGQGPDDRPRAGRRPTASSPTPRPPPPSSRAASERGLLIGKGGLHGNCLRIAPPLSLTEDEADEGAAIVIDAVDAALG